jgi:oligoendopeptidase F
MSKKAKHQNRKFHYEPQTELPPLAKIETEWNLKEHYYTSENDPQIEKDAKKYERAVKAFIRKYKNADFTSTAEKLLKALQDYERLEEVTEGTKVMLYFEYRTQLNVNDHVAEKRSLQYDERFRKLHNELIFFSLVIGKISKVDQKKYLSDHSLAKYKYLLTKTFQESKRNLSEAEEKILSLRSSTSRGMWSSAVSKIRNNRTITFKKKTMSVMEALDALDQYSFDERTKLWDLIMDEMEQMGEVAEHELSAIVTHDKISNELRGYKKTYTSSVESFENDEKAVEALIEAVSTKGFSLSRKFYKIKAGLHDKETLPYANRMAEVGELPRPTFEQSIEVCRDVFYGIDERYGKVLDGMLVNGKIDVYPKAGKRGSAFMMGADGVPTYVFLNYTSSLRWLEVIAHEVGHAVHCEMSKVQPVIYTDFTLSAAETASTLFEQLALKRLIEILPAEQRAVMLHDSINSSIAAIQRQIACFNYMVEMYDHISAHGMATKDELAKMMQKHLKAYVGPSVEVTEKDGYSYVYWGHIRRGYYVYCYAYGHLVSSEMIRRYEADAGYAEQIQEFLTAGGSKNVDDIFKGIGINTRNIETYLDGLKVQEREIKELERLTKAKK